MSREPSGSSGHSYGGRRASEFEPYSKTKAINSEKGEVGTEIDKIGTANEEFKVEDGEKFNIRARIKSKIKNEQIAKTKATPSTIQKFSNHIKFIDYIPTHELITYRHLFAYGFYVE